MGSYQSYLGLGSEHPLHPHSNDHLYQQLHRPSFGVPGYGGVAGQPASTAHVDLITRLFLLEKDLQLAQAENTKKEAVIQYLLHTKVSGVFPKDSTEKLKEEISSLREGNARYEEDFQEIRSRLRKARDSISTLSTAKGGSSASRSSSASGPTCSKVPESVVVQAVDLIDLSYSSEDPAGANSTEEETTLLEDSYDDLSEFETALKKTLNQSLSQSFSSDFTEDSSYIRHFVNDRSTTKTGDDGKMVKAKAMPSTSKAITSTSASIPFQNISPIPSPESDDSSQYYSSSPSGPVSASTSFSSSSDQEKLAISGWKNAASNANVDSTAPKPQDWNVDNALDTMRSSTYPLHQLDMVNEAGSALESLKEVANTSFPTVKATKESSRSTEIFHPDERDCVIMINRREAGAKDLRFPDLFRYGVRFTPDSNESNVYRTIRISGLPSDITMMKLLEKVRGGMVLDAKLLDTMSITGDMTGLVTFLHEHAAMAYEEHAGKNVISFNGLSAKITLVRTPTWPISIKLRKAINDFGHTRCFKVHHFPRVIKPVALKMELAVCSVVDINGVESMSMSKDDVLGLRFSSILFAGQASALFSCTPRYKGCVVQWIPDPCAQSLETLIENGNKELEVVKETSPVALIESVPEPTTFGEAGRLTQIHCDSAPEASDVLKVMTPMPSFELDPELDALISPVGLHQWSGRPSRKSLVDRGWRWRWRWRNDGC